MLVDQDVLPEPSLLFDAICGAVVDVKSAAGQVVSDCPQGEHVKAAVFHFFDVSVRLIDLAASVLQ